MPTAGMPTADLVYAICFSRVLCALRDVLCGHGLISTFETDSGQHIFREAAFVDDGILPVIDTADGLVNKATEVVKCVMIVFKMYGLKPVSYTHLTLPTKA